MASTLEIYDGSTTIDLQGSNYTALLEGDTGRRRIVSAPTQRSLAGDALRSVTYDPRNITIPLRITGSSQADLTTKIRDLQDMLSRAEKRQWLDQGTKVVLRYQMGNTDADDIECRILTGRLDPIWDELAAIHISNTTTIYNLQLLCEPFGRLSTITLGAFTLENEQDSSNVNFMDISDGWGYHLSFDGADDYVSVTDDAAIQNIWDSGGVVRVRINPSSDGEGDFGRIVGKNDTGGWVLATHSESGGFVKIRLQVSFSSTSGIWDTDAVIPVGSESMFECDYDSDSVSNDPTFRLDGVAITTNETTTPVGTRTSDATHDLIVGASTTAGGNAYDGTIDDLALFSASGATTVTQELDGDETNLAGYWRFNEGTGTNAEDSSSNSNDGTISGATWAIDDNIAGDAGGLAEIKIEDANNGGGNAWSGSDKMWVGIISGERRTNTLFIQSPDRVTEGEDPEDDDSGSFTSSTTGGDFTTNASAGNSAEAQWSTASTYTLEADVNGGYFEYDIAGGSLPEGLYRVLARVAVDDDINDADFTSAVMAFALGWNHGGSSKTPATADFVPFVASGDSKNTWDVLDLGEITIPIEASPTDFTEDTLNLRIHFGLKGANNVTEGGTPPNRTMEWYCDYVCLLPIDEYAWVVDSISTSDVVLASLISETPGIWKLDTSDVVQAVADSNPAMDIIGPETLRMYWIRGGNDDPTTTQAKVTFKYIPLVRTV